MYVVLVLNLMGNLHTINAMQSPEIALRKATFSDVNMLHSIMREAGDYYWENPPENNTEKEEYYAAGVVGLYSIREAYVVTIKETNHIVGAVGLNDNPVEQTSDEYYAATARGMDIPVSIHMLIAKKHRQNGFASKALGLLIAHTFHNYPHLKSISARIHAPNEASIKTIQKLHFAHVGIMSKGDGMIDHIYKIQNPNLL